MLKYLEDLILKCRLNVDVFETQMVILKGIPVLVHTHTSLTCPYII